MPTYIHQLDSWPELSWNGEALVGSLNRVRHQQGRLLGRLDVLGFDVRQSTLLQSISSEVISSFEIEGAYLDKGKVRSSVAKRLGIEVAGLVESDRETDGIVEMMLDATQNYEASLTETRLFGWHAALFPTGFSTLQRIAVGSYRKYPMQVVSGAIGKERIHFEAVEPGRVKHEMDEFIHWFETPSDTQKLDPILKAGIAHLRFLTVHPFDDGNGRIARALCDMLLARAEKSPLRYYSMSSQIMAERSEYYRILESTQKGEGDLTKWLLWFLDCIMRALADSEAVLSKVLAKAEFWNRYEAVSFNERQRKLINMMLDGFEGKLRTSKWAKITSCSHDTALRDIEDLIRKGILEKDEAGGRSTSYRLTREYRVIL